MSNEEILGTILSEVRATKNNQDGYSQRLKELKYSVDNVSRKVDNVEDNVEGKLHESNKELHSMLKDDYSTKAEIEVRLNFHANSVKDSLLVDIKRYAIFTGTALGILAVAYTFIFGVEPRMHNPYQTHKHIEAQKSGAPK